MAHSIVTWSNTPDTWAVDEQIFTVTERRYFIIEDGIIKSFDGVTWVDTGLTEPITEAQYLEHGMESLSGVTESGWGSLSDKFELIAWTDDTEIVGNRWIELTTQEFSPLSLLNDEDEFEILAYSNVTEDALTTTQSESGVVDTGQLFVVTIEDFDVITGVEVI